MRQRGRVLRGGSFYDGEDFVRCAARLLNFRSTWTGPTGFELLPPPFLWALKPLEMNL